LAINNNKMSRYNRITKRLSNTIRITSASARNKPESHFNHALKTIGTTNPNHITMGTTSQIKNLYLFQGKKLALGEIVNLIHPEASPEEARRYYTRYFQRLKPGVTLEQALALGMGPIVPRPRIVKPAAPVPVASTKPVVSVVTETPAVAEEKTTVDEQNDDNTEFERALAYASTVQVTFRQYQGRTLAHVLETEPSFIEWMRRKLVESADAAGITFLHGINKLYNDYPSVQAYIQQATEDYYTNLNASNTVSATTSLADNPKLKGLLVLNTKPQPSIVPEQVAIDPLGLNELQAEQHEEEAALQLEQEELEKRRPVIRTRLNALRSELTLVDQKIAELRPKAPEVSDHAVVRYIQRVMGMNIDELKREIVGYNDLDLLKTYQAKGSGRYMVGNTHRVCVENNMVTTVLPR
jgi:hypothetical protein